MNPDLEELVIMVAEQEGIDPILALALVQTESSFRPDAVSPVGAIGLAQVRPIAAKDVDPSIAREDLFDPETNLRVGFRYLKQQVERFGSVELALSAYNMGPSNMLQRIARGEEPDTGYREKVFTNMASFVMPPEPGVDPFERLSTPQTFEDTLQAIAPHKVRESRIPGLLGATALVHPWNPSVVLVDPSVRESRSVRAHETGHVLDFTTGRPPLREILDRESFAERFEGALLDPSTPAGARDETRQTLRQEIERKLEEFKLARLAPFLNPPVAARDATRISR